MQAATIIAALLIAAMGFGWFRMARDYARRGKPRHAVFHAVAGVAYLAIALILAGAA